MSLQSSIDYVLRYVGPPAKQVYKRTTVTPAGDSLLGLSPSGAPQHTDTLLVPQPVYEQLQDRAAVLSSSGMALEASDYEIVISSSSISITELEQGNLTFVLTDTSGLVEEYRVLGYNPSQFQGKYVVFCVYARRKAANR
jgi:hypothetical protein